MKRSQRIPTESSSSKVVDYSTHQPKSFSHSVENQLLVVYNSLQKKLECVSASYLEKFDALVAAWEKLTLLAGAKFQQEAVDLLLDWMIRDSLEFVLQGDWSTMPAVHKNHLAFMVQRCKLLFSKHCAAYRLHCLVQTIQDPWSSALKYILDNPNAAVDESQVEEFFATEDGAMLVIRLEVMLSSHCKDLALNLARMSFLYMSKPGSKLGEECATIKNKITDYYVVLIHKYKKTTDVVEKVLNHLEFGEAAQLVQRFSEAPPDTSNLWKNRFKIASLCASYLMRKATSDCNSHPELAVVVKLWTELQQKAGTSMEVLSRQTLGFFQQVVNTHNIYILCNVILLEKQILKEMRPIVIKHIIRALTSDLNEIESLKQHGEEEQLKETEVTLAYGFSQLAELFHDNNVLYRECCLTSFSLNPTKQMYEKIIEIAKQFGSQLPEEKSVKKAYTSKKLNRNGMNEDKNCASTSEDKLSVNSGQCDEAPIQLLDCEALGLSSETCDDLEVVLRGSRWHLLSWQLEWSQLNTLCSRYLNDPKNTRYLVKELKYVKMDFSEFKPGKKVVINEFYGIEEGYEDLLFETSSGKKQIGGGPQQKTKSKSHVQAKSATKTSKVKSVTKNCASSLKKPTRKSAKQQSSDNMVEACDELAQIKSNLKQRSGMQTRSSYQVDAKFKSTVAASVTQLIHSDTLEAQTCVDLASKLSSKNNMPLTSSANTSEVDTNLNILATVCQSMEKYLGDCVDTTDLQESEQGSDFGLLNKQQRNENFNVSDNSAKKFDDPMQRPLGECSTEYVYPLSLSLAVLPATPTPLSSPDLGVVTQALPERA